MGLDSNFINEEGESIAYFRKHADLHGFLADVWARETGRNPAEFNCEDLEITKDILDELSRFVHGPHNKHYSGFFWGASDDSKWEDTKEALRLVEAELDAGRKVYFHSWW